MLAILEPVRAALQQRRNSASWNLQLDKLSFERGGTSEAKKRSLDSAKCSYHDPGTQTHLKDTCTRQQAFRAILRAQHGANYREITLINSSRLLLHLGRASVLENVGLATDRSSGLPIIPGTAVKGILSTWACWEANILPDGSLPENIGENGRNRAQFSDLAERILGSNEGNGSTSGGEITFLGGFPVNPPKLVLDILTPHEHGDPLPNPFLALDPGTRWVFAILVRPRHDESEKLLQQVAAWLVEALTQVGLGAKTAAGYGRFRLLSPVEETALDTERQAIIAAEGAKRKQVEDKLDRQAAADAKLAAVHALARQKTKQMNLLSPEERAYVEYKDKIADWTAPAREIATKSEIEKHHILRFFRTPEGLALLKTWTNDKGKKRIQNLKDAGL